MSITRSAVALAAVCVGVGCAGHSRQSLHPIPDRPAAEADVRGTEAAARGISDEQQIRRDAQHLADELLQADRAFAAASARTDVISALSPMFDVDVIMPVPGAFADGKARAIEAIRGTPENTGGRLEWAPIRAGVSGDGLQGFTFGYMTLHKADSSRVAMKYMSYWIKRPDGWRVIAYKRRVRVAGDVAGDVRAASMPSSLPERLQPPTGDATTIARNRASLASAEKEFSDTAQVSSIGPAFVKYGLPDAVNMGGPNDPFFVVGSAAIGRSVGAGYPATGSPVSWSADHRVIVASSGDLGVTFGFIRPNAAPTSTGFPFFTIWKRASPTEPWRYIAE